MSAQRTTNQQVLSLNRKAKHDYTLGEQFEAGLVLEGWEVKSLRAGRAQLKESYISLRAGEAWLVGAHVSPLSTVSTHVKADPLRARKLLLSQRELNQLIGSVERKGFTIVPLSLYFKGPYIKLKIALAKGKHLYDKRQAEKAKDCQRQISRRRCTEEG